MKKTKKFCNHDEYIRTMDFTKFSGKVFVKILKQTKSLANNDLQAVKQCAMKIAGK